MRQEEAWLGASETPDGELLVHFYLPEGSHQIDAFVLNRCEAELLALIKEVGRQLDVSFDVEVLGYGEGGFSVLLKLAKSNLGILTVVGGAIVGLCTAADWYLYKAPLQQLQLDKGRFELQRDKRLADQQYEQNDLALKKAKLELKKLEQEVSDAAPKAPATAASQALALEPAPRPADVIPALVAQRKIVRHRSRFYETLLEYNRVTQVGFAQSHRPYMGQEVLVTRDMFDTFIVGASELESTVLHEQPVEIVSPVLRGTGKWRGLLNKKTIPFEIRDAEFLAAVALGKVKFQSGTTLVCDIEMQPVEDDAGEIASYVYTVLRIHRRFNRTRPRVVRKESADQETGADDKADDQLDLDLPDQ